MKDAAEPSRLNPSMNPVKSTYSMREQNTTAVQAFDEIGHILQEVLGNHKVKVYLFGSWVGGKATPLSDIDLAIEAPVPLPPGILALLRERLEESHVPYRVEVVELREVNTSLRRRILEEGILWSD